MRRTSLFASLVCVLISTCAFAYDWSTNPGDGTAGDPYQISTAEQLVSIGSDAILLEQHFILTADINMDAYTFDNSPIAPDTDQSSTSYTGENRFTGTLDGNYHRIRNLTIIRPGISYHIGLIGLASSPWEVKNLGLEETRISVGDSSRYLGGFVARGYGGAISDSYVTGSVTSGNTTKYMGGLMGLGTTNISNCYAMCTITNGTGSSSTGGAVGHLALAIGQLEKCYSTGVVDSESTVTTIGGLVGTLYNGAQANDCYYLSTAGPNNGNGFPRTSIQLKLILNYPNWEFNGAILGNQGHWRMRSDESRYPYLAWEFMKEDFFADFQIDLLDFAEFSQSWNTDLNSFDFNWLCDLNGNEQIELNDFRAFCDNWLKPY